MFQRAPRTLGTLAACTAAVLAAACQDAATAPTASAAGSVRAVAAAATRPTLDRNALRGGSAVVFDRFAPAARASIDGGQYQCAEEPTPVNAWFNAQMDDAFARNPWQVLNLFDVFADGLPVFEAATFQTAATPQFYGYTGAYTKTLVKTERDVKRFWDVPSAQIQVVGAHGTVLQDVPRVSRAYQVGFDLDAATGDLIANYVRGQLLAAPSLNGGNHPWFSFNAVATWDDGPNGYQKIVMGDGILEGYNAVGLGDVAPQAIFAHEFGHHIQHLRGYFADAAGNTADVPANTRYFELMADAYSAYYLTHSRGASMNRKRVEQFLATFYQIGDCGFTYASHHGTPNQRLAAARLGFTVADEAQKQGHILTAEQFHTRFVAAYPGLVAPDAVAAR